MGRLMKLKENRINHVSLAGIYKLCLLICYLFSVVACIACDEQSTTSEMDNTENQMPAGESLDAGNEQGGMATSGTMAGEQAGTMAGEQAGTMAGEQAGEQAGTMAGEQAGDIAGTMAGDIVRPPYLTEQWTWQIQDELALHVTPHPFSIQLVRQQNSIFSIQGTDLGIAIVDEMRSELSYDPYWLHHEFLGTLPPPPAGLQWLTIDGLVSVTPFELPSDNHNTDEDEEGTKTGYDLQVALSDGSLAHLRFTPSSSKSILLQLQKEDPQNVAYAYWQTSIDEQENFYGLGESFDYVARKGTYRAMNFQPLLETESGYNEAHTPVPLLISTHDIAYFYETYLPTYFDVGYDQPEILRAEQTYSDQIAEKPEGLKVHLIWHDHPFEALETYYQLTTRPLIPPYWSFAPHYWRNVTTGQQEVENDLQQMRNLSIPGGVFWIDRPYQNAYNDCQFDPNKYDDPARMMQRYQDLGYRMLLWHAPYTSEASDAWTEASEGNYFIEGPQFFLDFGKVMDFTNPDAVDLWQRLLQRFNTYNVAGYKLDYGEDVQVGINNRRLGFSFHDGSNELTMHHKYASYYHQTYLDTLPKIPARPDGDPAHVVDGFILGRSSTYNGQDRVHALWPGDLDSDFTTHLEDEYWVGGLPAGVVAGLTLAASGFPIFAADTGGFRNGRPTQEVLIRWAWQTAFSAIMQVGGGGSSHFPWAEAGSNEEVYDEQGIVWMREAAQWNMRLADYRFTWALHARQYGTPLMRPWGMSYPKDGRHPHDAYLLGPDLLIAPIIGEQDTREVPIPTGVWLDFWTQEGVTGPIDITRQIPLGSQAVMIRQGAIIPLLDEKIVTLNRVSEEAENQGIHSRINQPGTLTWLIAPGQDNTYQNHDGHEVTLQAQNIHINPAPPLNFIAPEGIDEAQLQRAQVLYELPVYPQFQLDVRFDANQATADAFYLDQVLLSEVNDAQEWYECLACVWHTQPGRVRIKLPPHQGVAQVITW